jgi:3-oxoacyl-[acyl-carrier-protein] synthase III
MTSNVYITGSFATRYGRHDGQQTLDLMSQAAQGALDDAHLHRGDIDALLCGYAAPRTRT